MHEFVIRSRICSRLKLEGSTLSLTGVAKHKENVDPSGRRALPGLRTTKIKSIHPEGEPYSGCTRHRNCRSLQKANITGVTNDYVVFGSSCLRDLLLSRWNPCQVTKQKRSGPWIVRKPMENHFKSKGPPATATHINPSPKPPMANALWSLWILIDCSPIAVDSSSIPFGFLCYLIEHPSISW